MYVLYVQLYIYNCVNATANKKGSVRVCVHAGRGGGGGVLIFCPP